MALSGIVYADVHSMTIHNGELYVGGSFTNIIGQQKGILKWNGAAWSVVGTGISGVVNAVCSFNGDLYVAGTFPFVGGSFYSGVAKWNGSSWSSVSSGLNPPANALEVYNGGLYAGATITGLNTNAVVKLDGNAWTSFGNGIQGEVRTFHVANNELYIGGNFLSLTGNTGNNIAKWNGSSFSTVGAGLDGPAYAIADYKNELFAGGYFLTSGTSTSVNFIAKWSNLVGTEENSIETGITIYPNPSNGIVTIVNESNTIKKITVYNALGQLVYLQEQVEKNTSLDLSSLSNGVHTMQVRTLAGV